MKEIRKSNEFKRSKPYGHILFAKWFKTRKLFTGLVYQSKTRGKAKLVDFEAFLDVLEIFLSKVDPGAYGTENAIKIFLIDFIKYASRPVKK